jgi:hypothetical protein
MNYPCRALSYYRALYVSNNDYGESKRCAKDISVIC